MFVDSKASQVFGLDAILGGFGVVNAAEGGHFVVGEMKWGGCSCDGKRE